MHTPVLDTSELVVRIIDDNLVLAHETLGQSWDRACETWASNDNRRPRLPLHAHSWAINARPASDAYSVR